MNLTADGRGRLRDFAKFGKHLILSSDIDPLYPVLRYLQRNMGREEALWHSFLYVAWYNLPSATTAFAKVPEPSKRIIRSIEEVSWPTGVERRNNRDASALAMHMESYLDAIRSDGCRDQWDWYTQGLDLDPQDTPLASARTQRLINWTILNGQLQTLYGNGRWAAYKHCEVLRRVNDFPVEAPDMGHQFSSGPREGLATLYGTLDGQTAAVIAELDRRGQDLQKRLVGLGLVADTEELETILCNWKSLLKGKYYVGHDIDELQEQIMVSNRRGFLSDFYAALLFDARAESLPNEYLGELCGWNGVQKDRMVVYRDRRRIVTRKG